MRNISTVLPSSHEIVASEQHTRLSMHKNKQQNKQNSDKQHFLATEQLRAAAAGRLLKMQFERKSLNSLLTVRTCRQRWSSCLLCHLHLHLHWKTQRLSPPSSTEQVQDHSQAYLTIKLKIDFLLIINIIVPFESWGWLECLSFLFWPQSSGPHHCCHLKKEEVDPFSLLLLSCQATSK